ncbi:MAG: isopenicillin N synthase family dioxygenase [bacterium]
MTQEFDTVPELSLEAWYVGSEADRAEFRNALYHGFKHFGFIILRDHNINEALLNDAYRLSAEFFALPEQEKLKYDSGAGGQRGYTSIGREHAKDSATADIKEFWHVGRENIPEGPMQDSYQQNIWPDRPAQFRETFLQLYDALEMAGQTMLEALAPSLGVPEHFFQDIAMDGNSILRLLHYPPIPENADPNAVRAAAHEDINLITVLVAASSSGLELLDRQGNWLPVEGSKNALIVDAGDMLARITNNAIPATTHRVVNPNGPNIARYSMPFFLHPCSDAILSCIDQYRDGTEMPDITADDFLQQRLKEIGLM